MDPRITTKDVLVNGVNYRLTKMDARLACWLFTNLAGKATSDSLISSLGKLSHSEFDEVQGHSLRFVSSIENINGQDMLTPIISVDGMWANKSLSNNPAVIYRLTTESIMFNIEPFLEEETTSKT